MRVYSTLVARDRVVPFRCKFNSKPISSPRHDCVPVMLWYMQEDVYVQITEL
uniref:Uncharacterized protein n=1 Tax=Arundo donax TaxID=35708 RepID=A0A0A9DB39_ARUDO